VIIERCNLPRLRWCRDRERPGVEWLDKGIIVVVDASTEDSKSVIDGFRGKVAAYFRPKSYQLGAPIFGSGLEVAKVWRRCLESSISDESDKTPPAASWDPQCRAFRQRTILISFAAPIYAPWHVLAPRVGRRLFPRLRDVFARNPTGD
jgi:hypothetical protein